MSKKIKLYYLKAADLFKDLSAEDMDKLEKMTDMVNLIKGQLIYSPGEMREVLFLLKQGKVQLYHLSPDGKKLVITVLEPGNIFGEMSLIGQGMYEAFAEVTEDAIICVIGRQNMVQLLSSRPAVALRLLEILGQRLLEAQASLESLAFKNVRSRLASLLMRLAKQQGGNVVGGVSHQDLAEMAATMRETVTETLDALKAKGLVELGRRRITILDPQGLKAMAEE